jgi:hypothetical protein
MVPALEAQSSESTPPGVCPKQMLPDLTFRMVKVKDCSASGHG